MSVSVRELQLALYDMLCDIDDICKMYNIKYSLACGTALGAVRHKGFIPWDDDLDIMFIRSEYDKFLEVAEPELKRKGYSLQKEFTDSWPMHFSKVRKDNTTYLEGYEPKIQNIHQGIFVDLFPIDNLSNNKAIAMAQWHCYHMIVASGLKKRGYNTKSIKKKLAITISPVFPSKTLRQFVMLKGNKSTERVHCFLGGAVNRSRNIFPRSLFNDYTLVQFENRMFPVVRDYDLYLSICFGNYMQLPPKEEQLEHIHAVFVDLGK